MRRLLQKPLSSRQTRLFLCRLDLSSEQSIALAVQTAHQTFGQINVVVNNAGYGIGGTTEELSQQEIRDSFEVIVFAAIAVVQQVMPFLRAQKSGQIINISPIAGFYAGWAGLFRRLPNLPSPASLKCLPKTFCP